MKHILCMFGIHKDELVNGDFETSDRKVLRTFPRCERCHRWAWPVAITVHNKITGEVTTRI